MSTQGKQNKLLTPASAKENIWRLKAGLKKCQVKWIKKAWNHVNTKTILYCTYEPKRKLLLYKYIIYVYIIPAHVCPVSPSDDMICSISFVPPLILHLIPCRIPPNNNLPTSTLQLYYQKGILCTTSKLQASLAVSPDCIMTVLNQPVMVGTVLCLSLQRQPEWGACPTTSTFVATTTSFPAVSPLHS